jgi:hypothetical protein
MRKLVSFNKILVLLFLIFGCQREVKEIDDGITPDPKRLDLVKFRGPDTNNNTLDDEKIEPEILKLHDDPYVQKLLIYRAIQIQRILENADDLEIVKQSFTEGTKPSTCFSMMYLNSYKKWSELDGSLHDVVCYSNERKKLFFVALNTIKDTTYSLASPGKIIEGLDWKWDYFCPFEFAPGDKEKYYRPWRNEIDERHKREKLRDEKRKNRNR